MNINAKNLIRLRALSPRNSVNVKIENVNVVEREKTHIQSRVKRFREIRKEDGNLPILLSFKEE